MYKSGVALCGAAALSVALIGSVARADSLTASLFSAIPPSGAVPTVVDLSGVTTPSQTTLIGTGYTVSFSGVPSNDGVVQGALGGVHAVPVAGVTSGGAAEYLTGNFGSGLTSNSAASGNYFSTGLGTITIKFSTPQDSLALLWGSIDTGNSIAFNDAAGFVATGTAVQAASKGFAGNGYQGPGGSAYVVVDTSTPFTTITATSSVISFEFAAIAAAPADFTTTPEPASLLLLGSGFGFIVLALVGRRYIGRAHL